MRAAPTLTQIKAGTAARRDHGMQAKEADMPASTLPIVIPVVAMFATFIIAVGAAAFWSSRG